jgi:hypothetical protein
MFEYKNIENMSIDNIKLFALLSLVKQTLT